MLKISVFTILVSNVFSVEKELNVQNTVKGGGGLQAECTPLQSRVRMQVVNLL